KRPNARISRVSSPRQDTRKGEPRRSLAYRDPASTVCSENMVSADVGRALRRRLVLIVVVGAVVPLGLVGLWTTRTAARSGRALLASQLEAQVSVAADGVARQWAQYRGDLMMLGESEPTRVALRDTARAPSATPSFLERAFAGMTAFNRVTIHDRT